MSDWDSFLPPIILSIKVAAATSLLVFIVALIAARWMANVQFRGKTVIETILLLPLVLPPTVVGFALLVAFGRNSPIGKLYEAIFDHSIVFSFGAAVIAAVVVAFPLAYRTMRAGFESVDPHLEDAARSMGATEWQLFRLVSIPLAGKALIAGYVLGFARGLGEFGATLMFAGNIPSRTQTVPTAIYTAMDSGNTTQAWAWAGAMVLISFLMLLIANRR